MADGGQPQPDTTAGEADGLQTLWVSLDHRQHLDVSVLWGTLALRPGALQPSSSTFLDTWHNLYLALDETVARHAVAKIAGTASGFLLAAGIFGDAEPGDSTAQLAACGLEILRAAREQVRSPDGRPAELQMGLHVGRSWSGMLGTSPPHLQLLGAAVEGATSLGRQGVPGFIQASKVAADRVAGAGGATAGGWVYGGWLQLFHDEASQVYLLSDERQHPDRLAAALAGRASDPAGLHLATAAETPALKHGFWAQREVQASTLERCTMAVAAPAAVLWLASRLRLHGWSEMTREAAAVLLLVLCAVGALTHSSAARTRVLRWCVVQGCILYALVIALQQSASVPTVAACATAAALANAVAQKVRSSVHLYAGALMGAAAMAALAAAPPIGGAYQGSSQRAVEAAAAVAGTVAIPGLLVHLWDAWALRAFVAASPDKKTA